MDTNELGISYIFNKLEYELLNNLFIYLLTLCTNNSSNKPNFIDQQQHILINKLNNLKNKMQHISKLTSADCIGKFEWVDGEFLKAIEYGYWVLLSNVNFASASVLDRLNPLLESNATEFLINECGNINNQVRIIKIHPNFRIFFTMDENYGTISRAMRNRCVEISFTKNIQTPYKKYNQNIFNNDQKDEQNVLKNDNKVEEVFEKEEKEEENLLDKTLIDIKSIRVNNDNKSINIHPKYHLIKNNKNYDQVIEFLQIRDLMSIAYNICKQYLLSADVIKFFCIFHQQLITSVYNINLYNLFISYDLNNKITLNHFKNWLLLTINILYKNNNNPKDKTIKDIIWISFINSYLYSICDQSVQVNKSDLYHNSLHYLYQIFNQTFNQYVFNVNQQNNPNNNQIIYNAKFTANISLSIQMIYKSFNYLQYVIQATNKTNIYDITNKLIEIQMIFKLLLSSINKSITKQSILLNLLSLLMIKNDDNDLIIKCFYQILLQHINNNPDGKILYYDLFIHSNQYYSLEDLGSNINQIEQQQQMNNILYEIKFKNLYQLSIIKTIKDIKHPLYQIYYSYQQQQQLSSALDLPRQRFTTRNIINRSII